MAAELVTLKVDLIFAPATPNANAARQATAIIPIVFATAGDPVANGLVASLAHPRSNATGLTIQTTDLAAKRIQLLREAVPSLRRLTIISNGGNPAARLDMTEAQAAGRTLGLEVTTFEIRRAEDITPAFEQLKEGDVVYFPPDYLVNANRVRISTLALSARLPTMYGNREPVEEGGLISYGPNLPDLYRRAAEYVDKILRGAKPDDIPVEQPTKFELVINVTTAKVLGLVIPPTLLARANELIE